MAIVSFKEKAIYEKNQYCNTHALRNVVHYVMNEEKTPNKIIGAIGAEPSSEKYIIGQFQKVKDVYRNTKGKKVIHFTVSFSSEECNKPLNEYLHIGYQIADFFENNYQLLFVLHENTDTLHLHFVVNTVSFINGKKLRWKKGDTHRLQQFVNKIL